MGFISIMMWRLLKASQVKSYRHGLDEQGLSANEGWSHWATEAEDGVGSCYQATNGEYTADWEDSVPTIANYIVCKLVKQL
jgi:hypothetical protein